MNDQSVEAISNLAISASAPRTAGKDGDGAPFVLVPEGYRLAATEAGMTTPYRQRGTVGVVRASDFAALVNNHLSVKNQPDTPSLEVFTTKSAEVFTAILNYDSWRDNLIVFTISYNNHFLNLREAMGKVRSQKDLIRFFEDFAYLVVAPESAKLLELAQNFRAVQNVRFTAVQELANGDCNFEYIKVNEAGTTEAKGKVKMPEEFIVRLPIYEGEELSDLTIRISYDIKEGALTFTLAFYLLHMEVNRLATVRMEKISELLNGKRLNIGTAETVKPLHSFGN